MYALCTVYTVRYLDIVQLCALSRADFPRSLLNSKIMSGFT